MNKLKKTLTVILSAVMIFSLFGGIGFSVNAEESNETPVEVKFELSTDEFFIGEEFTVLVSLENIVELKSAYFSVNYDDNHLKLLYVSKPQDAKYKIYEPVMSDEYYGYADFNIHFDDAFTGATSLVQLTFMPLQSGSTDISIYGSNRENVNLFPNSSFSLTVNQKNTKIIFDVSEQKIAVGDTFDVTVSLENAVEVYSLAFKFSFDTECLELVDMKPAEGFNEMYLVYNYDAMGASFAYQFCDDFVMGKRFSGNKDLAVLTFKALHGGSLDLTAGVNNWVGENEPTDTTCEITVDGEVYNHGNYDYLSYSISNGEVTITGCDEFTKGEVVIPSTIEGYPVTAIGNNAFYGCSYITNIIIPDSVTSISDGAFSFTDIKSITFPESVTYIGSSIFHRCKSLEFITVDKNNQYYSNDEYGVLFDKEKTILLAYPAGNTRTAYSIPDGVVTVCKQSFFMAEHLTSIVIPDSVTAIEETAFLSAWGLESIVIPGSVTNIGGNAFSCSGVKNVIISEGVPYIAGRMFDLCQHLESIVIPLSVTSIDDFAFDGCDNLAYVYYSGTEADWNAISIGETGNSYLADAVVFYVDLKTVNENGIVTVSENRSAVVAVDKTVASVSSAIQNEYFAIADKNGNKLANESSVGTGSKIQILDKDGNILSEYSVLVKYDVDGNGKITAADARLALRCSARLENLEGVYATAANIDGNDKITASDARLILRKSAKLDA